MWGWEGEINKNMRDGVRNRKAYSYKLEYVDLNGTATLHGPVQATPRLIYGNN